MERYFDWSFYSQGTRTEGDNAHAQTAADATVFVAAALQFFGDLALSNSPAPAWDKRARLAALVAQHRTSCSSSMAWSRSSIRPGRSRAS